MLLGLESEGVHVDTSGRGASVVLVRLHAIEVGSLALREAVLTVELDLSDLDGVLALALDTRGKDDLGEEVVGGTLKDALIIGEVSSGGVDTRASRETGTRSETKLRSIGEGDVLDSTGTGTGTHSEDRERSSDGTVSIGGKSTVTEDVGDDTLSGPVIGVVEGLLTSGFRDPRNRGRVAVDEGVALHDPDEFLHGVVEVHLDLVGGGSHGLITSELDLVDEVLVGLLGKTSALLGIEVDVVDVERSSNELELRNSIHAVTEGLDDSVSGGDAGTSVHVVAVAAVVVLLELNIDANLVVLEGDERDSKTGVAAVPELEGDVESLHGGSSARHTRVGELRSSAGSIESDTGRRLQEHEISGVTDHLVKRHLGTDGLGELSPDLHPVTVLTVDTGTTDLDLNLLDEPVTHIVEPPETITGNSEGHLGKGNLDVGAVHQISVTADNGGYTATEVSLTVESNFDCLHSEVGMPLVENLPEGNLRIARDINILCTIAYKLH